MITTSKTPPPQLFLRGILPTALLVLAGLLALAGRYGPHRDELYFAAAGRHPAWGYPDQPPLAPLLAALTQAIAPGSVVALHVPPALAVAGIVLLTGVLAREFGGAPRAQVAAAVLVGSGAGLLAVGHILSTTTFDVLAWTGALVGAVAALRRGRPAWWWLTGASLAVGVLNKSLALGLGAALIVGLVAQRDARAHLRSPHLWGAGALTALAATPGIAWQAAHGWPQQVLAAQIRAEGWSVAGRAEFVVGALLIAGPVAGVVASLGFARLWRATVLRPLAVAAGTTAALVALSGGKAYYLLGLVPALVAAGAVAAADRRDAGGMTRLALVGVLTGALGWPAAVPVLSLEVYARSPYPRVDDGLVETTGWPEVAAAVRQVVQDSGARLVVTGNYGEAGALEIYGVGVPVYSGHNGYGEWGPPPDAEVGPVVVVGAGTAPAFVTGCRTADELDAAVPGLDPEEEGQAVAVCDGPAGSWATVWPTVRHLSA